MKKKEAKELTLTILIKRAAFVCRFFCMQNDIQSTSQFKKDRKLAKKQSGNRTKTLKSIDRYENNPYDCDELFRVT